MPSHLPAAAFAALLLSAACSAAADDGGLARPHMVLREAVQGMPRGETQEVRVLTATFQPGDRTVFHTHRSPVTVYVRRASIRVAQSSTTSANASFPAVRSSIGRRRQAGSIRKNV